MRQGGLVLDESGSLQSLLTHTPTVARAQRIDYTLQIKGKGGLQVISPI